MRNFYKFLLIFGISSCLVVIFDFRIQKESIEREAVLQKEIAQEVVRFHIRANSDERKDQQLKMEVKKAVIEYLQPLMETVEDVQQAKEELRTHLSGIRSIATEVVNNSSDSGNGEIRVNLKKEKFPERTYGDCTFPAGIYDALVIELGEGSGHNWWCMIYPGLCFIDETYGIISEEKKEDLNKILGDEAYEWIVSGERRKVSFRWKKLRDVLYWVEKVF